MLVPFSQFMLLLVEGFLVNRLVYLTCFSALFCIGTTVVAYQDSDCYTKTIRSSECTYLTAKPSTRCSECTKHRRVLNAMLNRSEHASSSSDSRSHPSSSTNYRHLNTPEKLSRLHLLHSSLRSSHSKVDYLKSKLARFIDDRSVPVDSSLHQDLSSIMEERNFHICERYEPGTFQRIFWEQQEQVSKLQSRRSMRWDPLMIRWCLYLRHLSSSAYELLNESGVILLPSQRTLRDYTYYTTAASGFSGMYMITVYFLDMYM